MTPSSTYWTPEERAWAIGQARRILAPPPSPAPPPVEALDEVFSVDPLVKPLDPEPPALREKEEEP